jgi:hypothetical protein
MCIECAVHASVQDVHESNNTKIISTCSSNGPLEIQKLQKRGIARLRKAALQLLSD